MQAKHLVIILCSVFLIACGSKVARLPSYDAEYQSPYLAAVVIKLKNFDFLDLKHIPFDDQAEEMPQIESTVIEKHKSQVKGYDLRNIFAKRRLDLTANEFRIMKPARTPIPYNYTQSLYFIKPGIYYISYMARVSDNGVYYTGAPGMSKKGEIAYGAFEVQPGDVLYIGDLECQWKSSNKIRKVSVLDELKEVKKDLAANGHPDLAAKIIKAEFFPTGTLLSDTEDIG